MVTIQKKKLPQYPICKPIPQMYVSLGALQMSLPFSLIDGKTGELLLTKGKQSRDDGAYELD